MKPVEVVYHAVLTVQWVKPDGAKFTVTETGLIKVTLPCTRQQAFEKYFAALCQTWGLPPKEVSVWFWGMERDVL